MDLAIIGLLQAGKTTFFDALAGGHGGAARREHVAVVKLPDERLERLAQLLKPKKVTHAELRLHDLPAPAPPGLTFAPEVTSSIVGADALVQVVRAFHRDDVPHPQGSIDPQRDIDALEADLVLHDLAIVERRQERLDATLRSAPAVEREAGQRELVLLHRLKESLEKGLPLRREAFAPPELKLMAGYGLFTLKPMLIVVNIDEGDMPRAEAIESEVRARHGETTTAVAALCAKLEAELAELSPEEAAQFRHELGAPQPAVERLYRLACDLLGLVTFYTVVGEECRAWPVPAGTTALEAAGRIHSDLAHGFIRAEVIAWDGLLAAGSLAEAKKHGLLRSEGKQYAVRDGDVLHVLFHV